MTDLAAIERDMSELATLSAQMDLARRITPDVQIPDAIPATVEQMVLACGVDCPHDQMAAAVDAVAAMKQQVRLIDDLLMKGALREWIEVNGPVVIGTKRWTLAPKKKTVCKDNTKTFGAILGAAGGDIDTACEYLGSNPFKYGGLKKLLTEAEFNECFEIVVETVVVEGETKPAPKVVQCFDDAFQR